MLMIAVLVLLGGITVYAFGLVTSVHSGYAREISFARVDAAAQAGLDWGRYRVGIPAVAQCAAAQSINTLPGTLRPYTVTVRCSVVPFNEGGAAVNRYQIDATACNVPQGGQCPNAVATSGYVQRSVSMIVMR